MKARGGLVLLVCALGLLAAPAAPARTAHYVRPAGTELWIELGQKGDFEVLVEANDRQRVLLAFSEGLFTSSEYSTTGHVSSRHIEADFGQLGRIDVKVHLAPKHSWSYPPGRNCKGPASIYVPGTYRGTIEFSGEGDIPHLAVTHGEITFTRRFKRTCKREHSGAGKSKKPKSKLQLDVGLLQVTGKGEGHRTILEAINLASKQHPARSFGLLFAGVYERNEDVRIERGTIIFFGHESFRLSKRGKKPETVRLEPEEPFAGHAIYSHNPGSPPTWTGNLNIDLPGAKAIPLVGDDFDPIFCRGPSLLTVELCAYRRASRSRPMALARLSSLRQRRDSSTIPYGSGSHSQPLALARLSSLR
jgi:hypothetical protein